MWCLKCGKDTKNDRVFCPHCLEGMNDYPVKADVHIQLPNHENRNNAKKNVKKKRTPSPEEMVDILRGRNRRLLVVILLLMLMLGAAAYGLTRDKTVPNIVENWGKNYTVETRAE